MSQNLISITFTPETLAQIDGAIAQLEQAFTQAGFISLDPDERGLARMGDKSEKFCRLAVTLMAQNANLLPPSLNVAEAERDLAVFDALRPRLPRLSRLMQLADDTSTAAGSDVMVAATLGYNLLQIAGKGQGLDDALKEAGARWQKKRKSEPKPD